MIEVMIPVKRFGQIAIPATAGIQAFLRREEVVEAKAGWVPARASLGRNDDEAWLARSVNDAGCPPAKLPDSVPCPDAPTGQ